MKFLIVHDYTSAWGHKLAAPDQVHRSSHYKYKILLLAKVPGVARGILKIELKKKLHFLSSCHPQGTPGLTKKMSAN